jgi:hypothetical protein
MRWPLASLLAPTCLEPVHSAWLLLHLTSVLLVLSAHVAMINRFDDRCVGVS